MSFILWVLWVFYKFERRTFKRSKKHSNLLNLITPFNRTGTIRPIFECIKIVGAVLYKVFRNRIKFFFRIKGTLSNSLSYLYVDQNKTFGANCVKIGSVV